MRRLLVSIACAGTLLGCGEGDDPSTVQPPVDAAIRTFIEECAPAYVPPHSSLTVKIRFGQRLIDFPCDAYRPFAYRTADGSYAVITFSSAYSEGRFSLGNIPRPAGANVRYTSMPGDVAPPGPYTMPIWEDIEAGRYDLGSTDPARGLTYGVWKGGAFVFVGDLEDAAGVVTCSIPDVRRLRAIVEPEPTEPERGGLELSICTLYLTFKTGTTFTFRLVQPHAFTRGLPGSFETLVRELRAAGF